MSLFDGIGDVLLGVTCLVFAPVIAVVAIEVVATAGAVAVVSGLLTEAAVVGAGVAAAGAVEGTAVALGNGCIARGVTKSLVGD